MSKCWMSVQQGPALAFPLNQVSAPITTAASTPMMVSLLAMKNPPECLRCVCCRANDLRDYRTSLSLRPRGAGAYRSHHYPVLPRSLADRAGEFGGSEETPHDAQPAGIRFTADIQVEMAGTLSTCSFRGGKNGIWFWA